MATRLHLDDLRRAWEAHDPELADLVAQLAGQRDEPPATPVREGAPTFDRFLSETRTKDFRRKPLDEQRVLRQEKLKALEAPNAEVPLSDKLRLHEIILRLWQDNGPVARDQLLKIIAGVPLVYGPWRAVKRVFKEAEAKGDTEVFGAVAARLDMAYSRGGTYPILPGTVAYLVRRAWRYLRRLGQSLPAAYPDAAVDFLIHYTEANWNQTWVLNHIFYHQTGKYNKSKFTFGWRAPDSYTKHRAYAELWKRTPRPLFALLERGKCEHVREFAIEALKADFRQALREVEPVWVARLVGVPSEKNHEFVVWILGNVPRFEQAEFRKLGLHEAVLRLFDSPSDEARKYAANYARTHARDLPVPELIRLANNSNDAVRKVAADLLQGRDPRKDVGLDAWGQLLETEYGSDLAARMLRQHFGAKELTPAWFKARLYSSSYYAYQFAEKTLPQIHPIKTLGPAFLMEVFNDATDLDEPGVARGASWALAELHKGFDPNTLDTEFLKRLFVHPIGHHRVTAWFDEGKLKPGTLPVAFYKTLAYHPAFEKDPWVQALKASGPKWATKIEFSESLSEKVLSWLGDVRRFVATDLGIDWLMELVARSEPRYHDFAVEVMTKALVPADFAPKAAPAPTAAAAPTTVDLGGASFIFTGKMATMKREDAEKQVKGANGTVAGSVTAKLHYLVIGDEGSPLYGGGKKGDKQTKAEGLNAKGANIKIISETAFLQMLAGRPQTVSADASMAGSERLWEMATAAGPADAPVAAFAMKYLRRHHTDIGLAETDRPVDPGAEVPAAFWTFERFRPLFGESRKPLRDFAVSIAKWEFAKWNPPVEALIRLAEVPFADVRNFVAQALLAEDTPEHKRYRIDPAVLTPAAVYSFCESVDEGTRLLGMELIKRQPRLQVPEELFRLTESPDRKVRGFVIKSLWALYRDRGVSDDWKPYVPPQPTTTAADRKKAPPDRGPGVPPRPEQWPAEGGSLQAFLRRMLFEIPPGRAEGQKKDEEGEGITVKLKPLPHRIAKLELVEMLRDLALEEPAFAAQVLPVLEEFMVSRGKSERDACLVAVTRIKKAQGEKSKAVAKA